MKKLLIIVPQLAIGGQERVALRTARILKNDYDVSVLIFEKTKVEYEHSDIDPVNINVPASNNYFLKAFNIFRRIYKTKKIKRERKIDVAVSFGASANICNSLSKINEKCILSIRQYNVFIDIPLLGNMCHKKADITTGVSKGITDKSRRLYKLPREKVLTLYNPIDVDEIIKRSREDVNDYIFSRTFTIAAVGRLDAVKGFEHLIRAFSIVKNTFESAKLLIVGEGECRSRFENVVSELNLADSVTLLGYRENPYKYVAKSSVFVMSSEHEGFPNALAEAMCLAPVVSVDCKTGPREILSEGDYEKTATDVEPADYGILTPPVTHSRNYHGAVIEECDKKLAEGIIKMLSDEELYDKYKLKAAERVKQFSYESYRKNIIDIFEKKKISFMKGKKK